jgi:hypothetical protein
MSAGDAVSPAINRTKQFLFHPFKWSTFLKLATVAVITEGTSGNFNFSSHGSSRHASASGASLQSLSGGWIAFIILAAVITIPACIYLFYLVTRLRFAFFHCLVGNIKEIRPGWYLYRSQSLRFFKLSLIVALAFLALVALAVLPFALFLFRRLPSAGSDAPFDFHILFALFLPFLAVCLLLALVAVLIEITLHDFFMPHYALQNASAGEAWTAVGARFAAERGQFFLYCFLRLALPIAAVIGLTIVSIIPIAIVAGILATVGFGFHNMLAGATGILAALRVLLESIPVLIGICVAFVVVVSLGGPVATWTRNYALHFYGGRYPALGDLLYPPAPLAPPGVPGAPPTA